MMEKKKELSQKKDQSTTTGSHVTDVDSQDSSSHDGSADLNEDELAAFNAIMGDIDRQEEKQLDGTPQDTGTEANDPQDSSEKIPAALDRAIETISSEKPTDVELPDSIDVEARATEESDEESLDEDQQRAFERIMAQIESGELADTGSVKEADEDPESEAPEDFAAQLEKVATAADADADKRPAGAQGDEPIDDDGLDPDQQQALESIMAQIQGGGEADDTTGSGKEKDDEPESEAPEDFAAQLEKVATAADADDDKRQADVQGDEPTDDDGLDPDQQQALESIMAQIQGGGEADDIIGSEKETDEAPESVDADNSSAELEKVIQESVAAEDNEGTDTDDGLNVDQQRAFESIMAQIEGGDKNPAEPVSDKAMSADTYSSQSPEDQAQQPAEPTNEKSDDGSPNSPHDIEEILTEIAASDDESHPPEADSNQAGFQKTAVDASEKRRVDEDAAFDDKADSDLAHADHHHTAATAGWNGATGQPDESLRAKGSSEDPPSEKKPTPVRLVDPQRPEPLREASKTAVGRQKKVLLASVVAFLFLALAGYFYGVPRNLRSSMPVAPDAGNRIPETADDVQPAVQMQKAQAVVDDPSDRSRLKTASENLDRLRNQLIDKQAEIGELRAYYQAGIDAEIQAIADRVGTTGKGTISFKSATADPSISLGLSAIQRRDTYIKKLETPVSILAGSSEELLFFSRKAALLALMVAKTSDIDIDGFIQQADEVRNRHGSELARLNIDAVPASPRTLESIWLDVKKHLPTTAKKTDNNSDSQGSDTDNTTIWKDICDGDFSQKHRLTALSPEAARCLTTWKGKDLFLNALTDLSPEAARHLSEWQGDWLGLNGLTDLSPEAAVHLSRWKGKGLSLNSLSRLSPRVVAILSDWQGDQIELINVKHMAHWENPKTRLFLSEDLKRKLNATGK